MKLLRSITRRGYNVGTAGWFSVLKPNTWFPASRLPVPFRYRASGLSQAPSETVAPIIITLNPERRRPLRQALILVAAAGMVWGMLLWIMHP
ncbi:MAG TPA: hypothetical protein VGJ21_11715 [Terracidiphilus sp.]|jgi:hypothetical protein